MKTLTKLTIPKNNIVLKIILYYLKKNTSENKFNFAIYSNDFIGRNLIFKNFYEEENLKLFYKFLKSNNLKIGTCIDVGANIGNHSVFFSNFVKKIYAFEPNSKAYDLLKINIKKLNVKTFKVGLSNRNHYSLLTESKFNLGGSNVIKKIEKHHFFTERIKLVKLENYKNFIKKKIDLIKLDTEGHELKVLIGADKIIDKNLPIIIFEQNEKDISKNCSRVMNHLAKKKYIFYEIDAEIFNSKFLFMKVLLIIKHLFIQSKARLVEIKPNKLEKKDYRLIIAINKKNY